MSTAVTRHEIHIMYDTVADQSCVDAFLQTILPLVATGPQEIVEYQVQAIRNNLGNNAYIEKSVFVFCALGANDASVVTALSTLAGCLTGGGSAPYNIRNGNFTLLP